MPLRRWLPIALFCLACVGCGGEGDEPGQPDPGASDPGGPTAAGHSAVRAPQSPGGFKVSPPQSKVGSKVEDQLAALGYVAVSEETADPIQSGVTVFDRTRTQPGYNLYCMMAPHRAELLDLEGNVIHSWEDRETREWVSCQLLEGGDLLVVGVDVNPTFPRESRDSQRYLARYDWDGQLLWKRRINAHHHTAVAPDGDLLTLGFNYRTVREISEIIPVRDDLVLKLDADGQIVEERSLYDALSPNTELFQFAPLQVEEKWSRPQIDLIHANTVYWIDRPDLEERHEIYAPGHVIVTSRHRSLVAIIDWETNRLLWAWGPGEIQGPHDATVLDNGNILIFDNGRPSRGWSQVIELDPIHKEIVWRYRAPDPKSFFTPAMGANQRLANGNTLITNSNRGQAFEVTPEGEVVWEFWNPHLDAKNRRRTMRRVERLPLDEVDQILSARGEASPQS